MTTFDELALSATSSGKVSAWMALIDEAIVLDRVDDVWLLWVCERMLAYEDSDAVSNEIDKHCQWKAMRQKFPRLVDMTVAAFEFSESIRNAHALTCGDASATTQS